VLGLQASMTHTAKINSVFLNYKEKALIREFTGLYSVIIALKRLR
jgi:hypothetical protein